MLPKIYGFIHICIQFFYLLKRLQLNFCITVLTVIKYIRKTFDLKKNVFVTALQSIVQR